MRASCNSAFASIGGSLALVRSALELVDLAEQRPHPRLEGDHLGARPLRDLLGRLAPAGLVMECGRGVGAGGLVVGVDDQLRRALGPTVGTLEPQDPDRIDELGHGAGADARPERRRRRGRGGAGRAPSTADGTLQVRLERGRVLERRPQLLALGGDRDGELERTAQVTVLQREASQPCRRPASRPWNDRSGQVRTASRTVVLDANVCSWFHGAPWPLPRCWDSAASTISACPSPTATFCVLDLETTGGDRNNDLITEIGAVKVRGGECLGTFQTLVNPGRAIPPRITCSPGSPTRWSPRPRASSPCSARSSTSSATPCSSATTSGSTSAFLRAALERDGRPTIAPTVVDTAALARRLVRDEVPDCRLGTLAEPIPPRPPAHPSRPRRRARHRPTCSTC